MNWSWEPQNWKRSTKVLLGIVTIWPVIYMGIFVLVIFSFIVLMPFGQNTATENSENIDLIQLD